MRILVRIVSGIAVALFGLNAGAGTVVVSWKGADGAYFDDPKNWNSYFSTIAVTNMYRFEYGNKNVPYTAFVTNRQELVGMFNIKLGGSMPYGFTLDMSQGGVLKQVDGNGVDPIVDGGDPFGIWSNAYAAGPLYLSPSSKKQNMYILSNTVLRTSRTVDEAGDSTFQTKFSGGYVSFAEPNAANTASILQSGNDGNDAVRDIIFENVSLFLPIFKPRCGTKGGSVWFKGGECSILGATDFFSGDSRKTDGVATVKISDGAKVVHNNTAAMTFGYVSDYSRVFRMEVTGEGSEYSLNRMGTFTMNGNTILEVNDGARFEMCKDPGQYRYVYFGRTHGSCAKVTVDGPGSIIDARAVASFNLLNDSSITVSNGGTFILNKGTETSFGSSDAPTNNVTVTVRGEGSRLLAPAGADLAVGARIKDVTRATLNVEGGFVGCEDENGNYVFQVGKNARTVGTVNISGGEVRSGKNNYIWIGKAGSGTLNVSGGLLNAYKMLVIGGDSAMDNVTNSFRQTGGHVRTGDGLLVCGNEADTPAEANNRVSEVALEGGVLEASCIYGGAGREIGGEAHVRANGGTIKAMVTRTGDYPFICTLDSFAVGEKGLTIDTAGCDELVTQETMGDMPGMKGVLCKTGNGSLIFQGCNYNVSTTLVSKGSVAFRDQSPVFNTALSVTDGAVFSLAGVPSTVNLAALTIDGGTLELDAGDVITVEGSVSIKSLKLKMSAAPQIGTSAGFLVCRGELDDGSKEALRRAYCDVAHAEGYHGAFKFVYDEATGMTTISYESRQNGETLTGDKVTGYRGSGNDYQAADSWSNGVPDENKKAVFSDASAASEVTVPENGAVVGALGFAKENVLLKGGKIDIAAKEGSSEIEVTDGNAKIASPLELFSTVAARVSDGSTLEFSGAVQSLNGGIVKSGGGRLTVSGSSSLLYGFSLLEGTLSFASPAAGEDSELTLWGGTLETAGEEPLSLEPVKVGEDNDSVQIFKTETDTTVKPCSITGRFIKRGAGKMTVDLTGSDSSFVFTTAGKGSGTQGLPSKAGTTQQFPADGSAPEIDNFSGFTVAEGELVFKDDPATRRKHDVKSTMLVGMMTKDGSADPVLTIDGAYIDNYHASGHLYLGRNAGHANTFFRNATLRIVNGGRLDVDTPQFGSESMPQQKYQVTVALTNGTLHGVYSLHWSNYERESNPVRILAKDSHLWGNANAVYLKGSIEADLDNTYVGKNATTPGNFWVQTWSVANMTGSIALRNKSVFNINAWKNINLLAKPFTVSFDDSYYRWGGGDFTLAMESHENSGNPPNPDLFKLEMRGRGMIVAPASAETLTVAWPLTGEGGFVNEGEGTVAFGENTFRFNGVCEVVSGTVDLSGAGKIDEVKLRGEGTVRGMTASKVRLMAEADENWNVSGLPTFDGCSLDRVVVDFGMSGASLSNELPKGIRLGKIFGGTPGDVSRWRVANTGYARVRGRFSVDADGEVSVDLERVGLTVMVR
ncbi:MAG: hypothetical protein IKZ22_10710 [Kiritimatiellae bacterium]|nr:hypothetical protein [Kiritimatiellia bacterium]